MPLPTHEGAERASISVRQGDVQQDGIEPRIRTGEMLGGFGQRGRLDRFEVAR